MDPGLQGVVTDLAVSDAGEKVLLIVNQLASSQNYCFVYKVTSVLRQ